MESCPTSVYHNENIVETDVEDAMTGETVTMYEYDVTEYTNKEYIVYQSQQIDEQADALIELAELIGG